MTVELRVLQPALRSPSEPPRGDGARVELRVVGSALARVFALVFLGAVPFFALAAAALLADAAGLAEVDATRVSCDRSTCVVSGWLGATRAPTEGLRGARAEAHGDRTRVVLDCAPGAPGCDGGVLALTGWNRRPALVAAWREGAERLDGFLRGDGERAEVILPRSELPAALAAGMLAAAAFFLWVIGRNARLGAREVSVTLDGDAGTLELRERWALVPRRRVLALRDVEAVELRSYLRELPARGRMVELPFLELVVRAKGRRFPIFDRAASKPTRAAADGLVAAWERVRTGGRSEGSA